MNQVKTVLDITKKDGEQFKRWAHSVAAAATLNNAAKTPSVFLRRIYSELLNNEELSDISKLGFMIYGGNNKLNYLANYKPNSSFTLDFIMFKAEFVRLMIEKAGI